MHPDQHARHLGAYLWLLGIIIVLAALAYALHIGTVQPSAPTTNTTAIPIPTPTAKDIVTAQHGFQYLVQYTQSGFHPQSLSIKKGETVRFTNTATAPITISGASSSAPLAHGEYWEITPKSRGSLQFSVDANTTTNTMTITVK